MQIFLSYANEQRAVADELALALRERDHEVFLDRDDLKPGEGYGANIEEHLMPSFAQCEGQAIGNGAPLVGVRQKNLH